MGKEFPLARKEEEGQSVLLVRTSSGERITAASIRDKRAKISSGSRGCKVRKAKDTKTKSKGSIKTEGANASPSKEDRRGRGNQDRKSDRGDEGEDRLIGRSAQKLGIVHPSSYCDELETVPHYWVAKEHIAKGVLFQCKLCHKHLWLHSQPHDAAMLNSLIKHYGKDEGYCRFLNRHRPAKILMAKLQDLRRLEKEIEDKREFARIADRILSEKEYDKKE